MAFQVQPWLLLRCFIATLLPAVANTAAAPPPPVFDENYVAVWGGDGYVPPGQPGRCWIELQVDLVSEPESGVQDEVDLEFLGDKDGNPITLQTNVFVNGHGDREQRLRLWLIRPRRRLPRLRHPLEPLPRRVMKLSPAGWPPPDVNYPPVIDLMMFVDETPVRVLKNLTSRGGDGLEFPAKPMRVRGSVWDGSDWATDGGRSKVDWGRAPFTAGFRGFGVDAACSSTTYAAGGTAAPQYCGSPDLWWNAGAYRSLTAAQQAAYEGVMRNLTYDYCADNSRRKNRVPAECRLT
ncbi:hypothetical protein GUJ93_ZPchr0012g20431 [Zizania palustris]|uniref:Xyloglucan endotransglucosylase/hydrolase n=1 Tax=Zizania palustris TaxID=103762 RepID=A0A8J5WN08_ZIZPA|nr:hypothetical protein GUJ93_ZPchr0012g20431 [Zizania palustris]